MATALIRRRPLLLAASLLSLAFFAYIWFGPTGTSCTSYATSYGGSVSQCTSTTMASGIPFAPLVLLVLLSVAVSLIPLLGGRRSWVGFAWGAPSSSST